MVVVCLLLLCSALSLSRGFSLDAMGTDVVSTCACGELSLRTKDVDRKTNPIDCHCQRCRKYHVAAFATYIPTKSVVWEGEPKTYRDHCQQTGDVERYFCSKCCTKMATRVISKTDEKNSEQSEQQQEDDAAEWLVALGPVEESSVPKDLLDKWRACRDTWQLQSGSMWPVARPNYKAPAKGETMASRMVTGGCACGANRYSIDYEAPSELQHCYCRLCRQFTGAAYQTWIPVPVEQFEWTTTPEPYLVRTTTHGQRHMCRKCGGVLTIVYDEDLYTVWPAAGGLDDATLPSTEAEMSAQLDRVVHICCAWKQKWYQLPKDGMPRIDYAS